MHAGEEWSTLGIRVRTKERWEKAKQAARAEDLSDDAFLNLILDAVERGKLRIQVKVGGRREDEGHAGD